MIKAIVLFACLGIFLILNSMDFAVLASFLSSGMRKARRKLMQLDSRF